MPVFTLCYALDTYTYTPSPIHAHINLQDIQEYVTRDQQSTHQILCCSVAVTQIPIFRFRISDLHCEHIAVKSSTYTFTFLSQDVCIYLGKQSVLEERLGQLKRSKLTQQKQTETKLHSS